MTARIQRRALVRALFAVPIAGAAAAAGAAVTRAVRTSRPAATGTSSTRCAVCGSGAHSMLDRGCPGAGTVI